MIEPEGLLTITSLRISAYRRVQARARNRLVAVRKLDADDSSVVGPEQKIAFLPYGDDLAAYLPLAERADVLGRLVDLAFEEGNALRRGRRGENLDVFDLRHDQGPCVAAYGRKRPVERADHRHLGLQKLVDGVRGY